MCSSDLSGNAIVYGDARVSGNARVYGEADIQSSDDWFSFIYEGKTLTGYRSRNDLGYELNVDGMVINLDGVDTRIRSAVRSLIDGFTPFSNPEKENLEKIVKDLQTQLTEAQAKLANL